MTIQLDFRSMLGELAAKLKDPTPALRAISASLSEESLNLIRDGFRNETDPYGERWQPKQRPDGRMTLSGPTSRLKGLWHRDRADENGFRISSGVDYSIYHQRPLRRPDGRLKRPRRMQVPEEALGLPPAWGRAYEEAALDAFDAYLVSIRPKRDARGRFLKRGT